VNENLDGEGISQVKTEIKFMSSRGDSMRKALGENDIENPWSFLHARHSYN
jgi:hypothetical protein